jgi:glycine oxidase
VGGSRDVVVVGAGIVGCAIAHELARRGVSVVVTDMRAAGMGATQASAGILAPYIEAAEGSALLELTVRSLALFDDFVGSASADSGIAVPYRRTGTLDVALDDRGMEALRETARVLARRRVAAHILDRAGVHEHEPHLSDDVLGGLFIPTHGFVAASELTRALAAAARRRGAQIIEHGAVRCIARDGDGLTVETDRGSLSGDTVVMAAGSWSGSIAIEGVVPSMPLRPIRGQLLRLGWVGAPLRRVIWSPHCYLVPWDDGTVLVGATAEDVGFDERTTVAGVSGLLDAARALMPDAANAAFLGARVGLRPASSDELPIIGASSIVPNLIYATGHYRNGILLAPLTANLVADALVDGRMDPLLAPLSPRRFGDL